MPPKHPALSTPETPATSCLCIGDEHVTPLLECFDCYQGGPCGGGESCTANVADGSITLSCTCVDGCFDCVEGGAIGDAGDGE
jgi:hypothetical protein